MFFNFHTHQFQCNALISACEKVENAAFWSLEYHPWHLPESFVVPGEDFFEKLASASALGEIGLDRLKGPAFTVQRQYFSFLLEAAARCRKPVVIHAVRCDSELDAALKNFSGKVLIHGFRGGEKRLAEHLDAGRFVSFAPGGWRHCTALLKQRGLARIGLETDDAGIDISSVYRQAQADTGIAGWEEICEKNFLQFIR